MQRVHDNLVVLALGSFVHLKGGSELTGRKRAIKDIAWQGALTLASLQMAHAVPISWIDAKEAVYWWRCEHQASLIVPAV